MELNSRIYVDKSMLISKVSENIGTGSRYICITKPRRFGKSVNACMLAAYYTKTLDTHDLFDGLQISSVSACRQHLNQHHVIFIDFSRMPRGCENYDTYIQSIEDILINDIQEAFPATKQQNFFNLDQLLVSSGEKFIFILDEWDAVFYEDFMTDRDKVRYLKFLRNLLKGQAYVELAYMTGVLPITKYSSGSALNMFEEFSFLDDDVYDSLFGFTEDEVLLLCQKHTSVSFEEIKYWYDGYFTSDGRALFNPRSVNYALTRGKCRNYWTETGPMNEIADCIEHNVDEVREDIVNLVSGIPVEIRLNGYSASDLRLDSRDEILSAMVVFGFLSYHDLTLRIPNHELMEKFQTVFSFCSLE